jgi:hypothetical protein
MNKKFLFVLIVLSLMFVLTKPANVFALGLNFDASISKISVGDTTLVKVYINTEGKEINALEGAIQINGPATISSINTGGSIFSLWPETPQLNGTQEISFTGGTGGGVYGNNLRIFNFSITPTNEGNITLTPVSLTGYLDDGTGTKLTGNNNSFTIQVVKQIENSNTNNSVPEDKTPPDPFTVDLGRDASLFDGKYFISFYATDDGSGVNKYEVKEGNSDFVVSGNTYVLKDQTLRSKIYVKAIDNAGNERVEVLNATVHTPLIWKILEIILFVFVVIVIVFFYKVWKKKRNKNNVQNY